MKTKESNFKQHTSQKIKVFTAKIKCRMRILRFRNCKSALANIHKSPTIHTQSQRFLWGLFLLFFISAITNAQKKVTKAPYRPPIFPGCTKIKKEKLSRILRCNKYQIQKAVKPKLFYPIEAVLLNQEGQSLVAFVVSKKGQISNVHIKKSSGNYALDLASIYSVATMFDGEFIHPATNEKGDFVNVEYTIPIMFSLNNPDNKVISNHLFKKKIKNWKRVQQLQSEKVDNTITTQKLSKKFEKLQPEHKH